MPPILARLATPLTTGLFAVSAISGVALFFHLSPALFHDMHEWLSLALLVPLLLHVWRNWGVLAGYARKGALLWPALAVLAAAAAFAVPVLTNPQPGLSPGGTAVRILTRAPLADLAPLLKTTPEILRQRLNERGYPAATAETTLEEVAIAAGKPAARLLVEIAAKP